MSTSTGHGPRPSFDAALHLLDRQIIDSEGLLLGKVDDVALRVEDAGVWAEALLTGAAAWLPRFWRGLADQWVALNDAEPRRGDPWAVEWAVIDGVDSAVHLSAPRGGLLRRRAAPTRLTRLLGMRAVEPDGRSLGRVVDARFGADLMLTDLVLGHGRAGLLLGYDRHPRQGPWLVRQCVMLLVRPGPVIPVGQAEIDWESRVVHTRAAAADAG